MKDRKNIDRVLKQGGKPADVYYAETSGCLYIIDRDGVPVPFMQVEDMEVKLKTEEGFGNIGLKIQEEENNKEWYKDFPSLGGVFSEYGQD